MIIRNEAIEQFVGILFGDVGNRPVQPGPAVVFQSTGCDPRALTPVTDEFIVTFGGVLIVLTLTS